MVKCNALTPDPDDLVVRRGNFLTETPALPVALALTLVVAM